MPRQARKLSASGLYHVVVRGVSHQILFEEREDYVHYLDTLSRLKASEPFEILAYCLMDNHVHLLLQKADSLDRLMKRLTCSYAYYYNEKYERSGHLLLCAISTTTRRRPVSQNARIILGAAGMSTSGRRLW